MNKKIQTAFIALIIGIVQTSAYSKSQPKIGYGSSNAVLPAKNQELFFMGFDAGLRGTLVGRTINEVLITQQLSDGTPLGAIRSAESLVNQGAVALVGFPTSHEALLASKVALQNEMLAVFAGAGHTDLAKSGPLVYTTGESMKYSVESMLNFIGDYFPKRQGALITNPYAVFSKNQEDTFIGLMKNHPHNRVKMMTLHLNKKLKLSQEDMQRLKQAGVDYLCLTPYADESVQLLEQMEEENLDLPIISNSSWTTGDIESLRRFLTNRKTPVYSAALWIKGSPESRTFEEIIHQRYGREPTSEMAYGYDLGVIMGQTLNAVKGPLSRTSIPKAFQKLGCFRKTSNGKMCFKPEGGHATRKITFVQFSKAGFIPLEQK